MISKKDRKVAVAIDYAEDATTPHVLANGAGSVAQAIVDIAIENGIPIHEDATLAGLLSKSKVGEYIDPKTSKVVAEIICFLYKADQELEGRSPLGLGFLK